MLEVGIVLGGGGVEGGKDYFFCYNGWFVTVRLFQLHNSLIPLFYIIVYYR